MAEAYNLNQVNSIFLACFNGNIDMLDLILSTYETLSISNKVNSPSYREIHFSENQSFPMGTTLLHIAISRTINTATIVEFKLGMQAEFSIVS